MRPVPEMPGASGAGEGPPRCCASTASIYRIEIHGSATEPGTGNVGAGRRVRSCPDGVANEAGELAAQVPHWHAREGSRDRPPGVDAEAGTAAQDGRVECSGGIA